MRLLCKFYASYTRSLETEEFHNRHLCIQSLKLSKTKILKDYREIER